ncbi:MAG TPA: hypothetical protein EYG40_09315 [Verrucomicrobia bacterium]|nr:hypothetical protein [Verrucomicrobiales bacterium]HIL55221.1 hypothetical protein [Verrucomicrobiota bacterium]
MSVVAIVLDESNIDEMRGWSASIAQSLDVPLKVSCVQNNENFLEASPSASSKPEGDLQVTDVIPLGSTLIEKLSSKILGHSEVSPSQEKG